MAAPRLQGTIWKKNAGFLRQWRSRPAVVTDDGFLRYKKSKDSSGKMKEIDLVKSDISHKIAHSHGYYFFEVKSGSSTFSLGFPQKSDADMWLEAIREVADENAAGRRAWVANLRHMLSLPLHERKEVVEQMRDQCLAEIFFINQGGQSQGGKLSEQSSDLESDQRSIESSASSSNGTVPTSAVSPKSAARANHFGDVEELKFKTIRLQFGAKSWRGRKRLGKEIDQLAKFRVLLDFVLSEKIVEAKTVEKFPVFPLVAAFSIRGIRVVATAESLRERFNIVAVDKRDVSELVQMLKLTKMLRAFPYSELPEMWANSGDGSNLELLTAHDMSELVQNKEAHWIPYLDLVYYQLESGTQVENLITLGDEPVCICGK
uniref:PH domain-containing protein n=1 Tax=Globisporangium ultimum (strain ATCC 200006 / CBS 805.95 / DAOM BR144) TaxID=431595 RepID=K3WC08_GLOUD